MLAIQCYNQSTAFRHKIGKTLAADDQFLKVTEAGIRPSEADGGAHTSMLVAQSERAPDRLTPHTRDYHPPTHHHTPHRNHPRCLKVARARSVFMSPPSLPSRVSRLTMSLKPGGLIWGVRGGCLGMGLELGERGGGEGERGGLTEAGKQAPPPPSVPPRPRRR